MKLKLVCQLQNTPQIQLKFSLIYEVKHRKSLFGFLRLIPNIGFVFLFFQAKNLQIQIGHWANHYLPMPEQKLSHRANNRLQYYFQHKHALVKNRGQKSPEFLHQKLAQWFRHLLNAKLNFQPFCAHCAYDGCACAWKFQNVLEVFRWFACLRPRSNRLPSKREWL